MSTMTGVSAAPPLAYSPTSPSGAAFEPPGADGIGRIVIDRPDDAVNALNPPLIEALAEAVRAARSHEGLKGLILASGKPGQWIAGADLHLVATASNPKEVEATSRRFQAVCDELTWLPCTTVAAISGPALGGGYEVALACDYRVAADSDAVSVGLPEVTLGLVPAGGGTQRLPRLVGLPQALDLVLAGKRLNAKRALRAGLVDEVVHPAVLEQAARAWARKPKRSLDRPLNLRFGRPFIKSLSKDAVDLAEQTPQGRQLMYRQAREAVLARTNGHYPAPLKALEAISAGFEEGLAAGLEAEATAFGELATGPIARNLIRLFLATQRQKRDRGVADESVQSKAVDRLGVVGVGFMGSGIAEVAAASGLAVRVRDVKAEAVAKGLASIRKTIDEGVTRRRFDRREAREILQRVSGTTDYSGFSATDLVIEAVFEDLNLKRQVVRELEEVVRADAVLASNTSALPIGQIAAGAKHPERVVGMHFFSPVHRMPLLEVVRADSSADWAVATAVGVGNRLGKTVIVVRDGPGFYTTRVLGVMMSEAAQLLSEGAAMDDVDRAMTAFGFPVGPFVLYDEVGLDVAQHVGETLTRAFGERQPSVSVVSQLVAQGHTGKKAGCGFLRWDQGLALELPFSLPRPQSLPFSLPLPPSLPLSVPLPASLPFSLGRPSRSYNPTVYELLGNPPRREFGAQEVQDRLVSLFVNEAIRCLEEGVLRSPIDGDLGAVLGLGFPPFHGGPFRYADALGPATLHDKLERLAEQHGPRYQPAGLLVEKARKGETFHEGRPQ
jgi:3-hydroxyacyl-CoA dehydrogenase/enoyl-CoA hydratase/3-hydroxybutyryl-CoA epimerase